MREKVDAARTGEFLAALRKARGLTQEQVAEELCVSNKTISKWESGSGLPDITILPDLAEFYGVTADDILAGQRLQSRETTSDNREKHWQRLYRSAETRMMVLGCSMVMLPLLVMLVAEISSRGTWVIGQYLRINEILVLLCTVAALVVLWYSQRNVREALADGPEGFAERITVVSHRLMLLVPLVSILCLREGLWYRVANWQHNPFGLFAATLSTAGRLLPFLLVGGCLLLFCRLCKRTGCRLLGPTGEWVLGIQYGLGFVAALGGLIFCIYGQLQDRTFQTGRQLSDRCLAIGALGGKASEYLLVLFVVSLGLYTVFRLEEEVR